MRAMGLDRHIEFNKGAVMVLPAGITKSTGLACALNAMLLSPHNVIGVGDAENDQALLAHCGCAVSVQNALPSLKERSDWVTSAAYGAGVEEVIGRVLSGGPPAGTSGA
jgi:hydroxymethylpyrimidine pyrophosphatase-like HAD family hydrolase